MQSGRNPSLMEGIETKSSRTGGVPDVSRSSRVASFDAKTLALAIGGVAILVVAIIMIVRSVATFGNSVGSASRLRVAVDAESGKVFENYLIKDGESWPWKNPSTGMATLYPPEECWWTSNGEAKLEPTYVLLNSIIGKEGPTTCPDCGREVVAHNPMPPAELLLKAAEREKSGSK